MHFYLYTLSYAEYKNQAEWADSKETIQWEKIYDFNDNNAMNYTIINKSITSQKDWKVELDQQYVQKTTLFLT